MSAKKKRIKKIDLKNNVEVVKWARKILYDLDQILEEGKKIKDQTGPTDDSSGRSNLEPS